MTLRRVNGGPGNRSKVSSPHTSVRQVGKRKGTCLPEKGDGPVVDAGGCKVRGILSRSVNVYNDVRRWCPRHARVGATG